MNLAVIVWDTCSDYMPWWYCALFQSETAFALTTLATLITIAAALHYGERRA